MYEYLVQNYRDVETEIAAACSTAGRSRDSVNLITVTKTYPAELVQAVIDTGHVHLGENRPQEIMDKAPVLTGDHTFHLIGQLQTNKVRKVIPLVQWIHSVDRDSLLDKIDTIAAELNKPVNILIQVNTSGEESKSGCTPEEAVALCQRAATKEFARFCGLMTIGPVEGGEEANQKSFTMLREIGEQVKHLGKGERFELSMGMSGDFAQAIAEGSTMIRVGSRIVGARSYP